MFGNYGVIISLTWSTRLELLSGSYIDENCSDFHNMKLMSNSFKTLGESDYRLRPDTRALWN